MSRSVDDPLPLRPPYPGLAAYQDTDEDAALFFGRTAERDLIIANLRSARLTVLYGSSGVGKSSLLHAGVVHRLRTMAGPEAGAPGEGDGHPAPVIIIDHWLGDAAARLIAEIQTAVGDGSVSPASAPSLDDALGRLRASGRGALLVILDQFEEYLRLHPQPVAAGFDDLLCDLVTQPEALVRVLVAVRDDRLADLDRFEGRIPNLLGNFLRLEPLTREAAGEAIVRPVERYNARIREQGAGQEVALEPGLADRVLDELGELGRSPALADTATAELGDPQRASGSPPADAAPARADSTAIEPAVLQLTMRRLWDADIADGGTTLRLATLSALGGAGRIFATHLDTAMGALPATEQRLAADILRFLVSPSGVTRSYSAADLSTYIGRPEPAIEALAEKLSRPPARILRAVAVPTGAEPRVEYELSHQVLARPALDWRSRYQTSRLQRRAQRLLLGLVALGAVALTLVGYALQPGPLRRLDLNTVDGRFALRGTQSPDRNVVLVTVDDRAFPQFMSSAPPRATIARALDIIAAAAPRVIVADIIFTGPSTSRGADAALIKAIHRDGSRLVLATDALNGKGQTQLFGRVDQLFYDRSVPAVGYAGFPGNPKSRTTVIRTMQRSVTLQPGGEKPMSTLAVVAARMAGLNRASLASLPATTWIAFRGGAGTFPSVPLAAVVQRRPATLSLLRDKIVVLGVTAQALEPLHKTSAPGRRVMSGPEIQANAISTAVRGFPLRDWGRGVDVALIVLLGLIPLALALRLSALWCAVGALAAGALFCVGAQLAFNAGRVISVVYPLISLALSAAGVLAVLLLRARSAS